MLLTTANLVIKNQPQGSNLASQNIKISFDMPLGDKYQGKILQAKITAKLRDSRVQLTLNDGKTISAKIEPPLPKGTKITFSVPQEGKPKLVEVELPKSKPLKGEPLKGEPPKGEQGKQAKTTEENLRNNPSNNRGLKNAGTDNSQTTKAPVVGKNGSVSKPQATTPQSEIQNVISKVIGQKIALRTLQASTVYNTPNPATLASQGGTTAQTTTPITAQTSQIMPSTASGRAGGIQVGAVVESFPSRNNGFQILRLISGQFSEKTVGEQSFPTNITNNKQGIQQNSVGALRGSSASEANMLSKNISNPTKGQIQPQVSSNQAISGSQLPTAIEAKFTPPLPLKTEVTLSLSINKQSSNLATSNQSVSQSSSQNAEVIAAKAPPSNLGIIRLAQPVNLTNMVELSTKFTPTQHQQIVAQTRFLPMESLPPIGTEAIAKVVGEAKLIQAQIPNSGTAQSPIPQGGTTQTGTLLGATRQVGVQQVGGQLVGAQQAEVQQTTAQQVAPQQVAGQNFQQVVQLDNGLKLIVKTPIAIAEGTQMTIRFTADGVAEVLRIIPKQKINEHTHMHHDGDKKWGGQQATEGKQATSLSAKSGSTIPALKSGSILLGSISSQGEKGLHNITFQDGRTFQVQAARTLPINAQVKVVITPNGNAQIVELTLPAGTTSTKALTGLSLRWNNLEQAISMLERNNPQLAQKLRNNIPNGENFLPAMLNFSDAIISSNLQKLINNDTMNILRALGIDFSADITGLNQLQQRHESGESWRSLLFPYIEKDGEPPRQGSFFWRNQTDEENPENTHIRFVVNMALSNIGAMQLDGLMHEKTLNIKLRIHKKIDENFVEGLQTIVGQTLQKLGLTGGITVETTDYFEADPLHEVLSHHEQINVTI